VVTIDSFVKKQDLTPCSAWLRRWTGRQADVSFSARLCPGPEPRRVGLPSSTV